MINTRITDTHGLDYPIASAGMAFVARPQLVAAVSNVGGMGFLGADMTPPPGIAAMIAATRELTSGPFGIDFVTPFFTDEHLDACVSNPVAVVVFFWGLPKQDWIDKLHSAGTRVWLQVGSLAEARQATNLDIDALIVQSTEAGGHNHSSAGLMVLLPAVVDAVAPLPVIAAGGIVDGRGLAAALVLGADAVWCGTRFLASEEANAHAEYKRRVVAASVDDTVRTTLFGAEWPGQPMRVVRNRVVQDWLGREQEATATGAGGEPIGHTVMGGQAVPIPKFSMVLPTPETEADFEEMGLTMGESAGQVTDIKPAAEIVSGMGQGAEKILDALSVRAVKS